MSKHVLIVRHAQALDALLGQEDHDRPLSTHGAYEAKMLATYMQNHHIAPDHILCSTATRTRATAAILEQEAALSLDLRQNLQSLYLADAAQLQQHLSVLDNNVQCLMVIAHNPGVSEWAYCLASPREKETLPYVLHTAGLLHFFSSSSSWHEVAYHQCRLLHLFDPSLC
ncbi:MAG: hypothetical protein EAZ52_05685 [Alphaproteobacteria bacterium]|nr:MAG: hypothetical protein EAZ52_05685 [Alphaproteobacteria bacterium]